jgi:hypothetical protein
VSSGFGDGVHIKQVKGARVDGSLAAYVDTSQVLNNTSI